MSAGQVSKNTVGKGEFAPTVVSARLEKIVPLLSNLELSSAKSLSLEESKICRLAKG